MERQDEMARERMANADRADAAAGLGRLFEQETAAEAREHRKRRAKEASSPGGQRLANHDFIVHLDNQFRKSSGKWGLSLFLPSAPPRPLKNSENRYMVMAPCPLEKRSRLRACIKDMLKGTKRFEVPLKVTANGRENHIWHVCQDMGSVGWVAVNWLLYGPPALRGSQQWDRLHRLHNDWLEGIAYAGLTLTRLEFANVMKARCGPFNRASNHRKLVAAAKEMKETCSERNAVFESLYTDIASDLGMDGDADYGSPAHMRRCWDQTLEILIGQQQGEPGRLGRWNSFEVLGRRFLGNPGPHAMLMLLVYYGWRRSWWLNLNESPLVAQDQEYVAGPEPEEAPDEGAEALVEEAEGDGGGGGEEPPLDHFESAAPAGGYQSMGAGRKLLQKRIWPV